MAKFSLLALSSVLFLPAPFLAQTGPANLSTASLLSDPGPTFRVDDRQLPNPVTFIAYGDQRFTDPANTRSADPRIRAWLVGKIASEKPGALVLNGDVPLNGDMESDYAAFRSETQPWRAAHLRVYPALGNHEFAGPDPQRALEHW
ncbi:MAG: metallophosphoesterase, partial [Acidobacteriota bacterium]|nr:metallophosphoesterase [Acidobacteriota bacterium]